MQGFFFFNLGVNALDLDDLLFRFRFIDDGGKNENGNGLAAIVFKRRQVDLLRDGKFLIADAAAASSILNEPIASKISCTGLSFRCFSIAETAATAEMTPPTGITPILSPNKSTAFEMHLSMSILERLRFCSDEANLFLNCSIPRRLL
jgi:hypothetical protein